MKTKLFIIVLFAILVSGCSEDFIAGTATGVALREIADKAQNDFIIATNEIISETERLNKGIEAAKGTGIVGPGQEKNPFFWISIAEALGLSIWGGRALKGRGQKV